MAYPSLNMPPQFARSRDQWSKSEAREVLAWLIALIEPRTDVLLSQLGMSWDTRPKDWLAQVEARVPIRIWSNEFWLPSEGPETIVLRGHVIEQDMGPTISGAGEPLGADLGCLLARSFAEGLGEDAHWVVGSHGRTYVSNNLPILKGRGQAEYDPLLIGLNIASRWLPGQQPNPHRLGLSDLHDHWLRDLADPAWGTAGRTG
jgi:hypothetical protein